MLANIRPSLSSSPQPTALPPTLRTYLLAATFSDNVSNSNSTFIYLQSLLLCGILLHYLAFTLLGFVGFRCSAVALVKFTHEESKSKLCEMSNGKDEGGGDKRFHRR